MSSTYSRRPAFSQSPRVSSLRLRFQSDPLVTCADPDQLPRHPTQLYEAGLEGAPKNGVGLMLDTDGSVTPATLDLQTDGGGWKFNVYASDEKLAPTEGPFDDAGAETGAWGEPLATDESADKNMTVELGGASGRHFLIWITDLNGVEAAEIFGAQLQS